MKDLIGPLCVFCGSSNGKDEAYRSAARSVGKALAEANIPLIYGGGTSGLMGLTAASAVEAGGEVHGIIPRAFLGPGEQGVPTLSDKDESTGRTGQLKGGKTSVVGGMHERKTLMAKLATGGFVVLPGGFGTFEEAMEMTTWSQLGIHFNRPVLILSVRGFYAPLKEQILLACREGFIHEKNLGLIKFVEAEDEADWGALTVKTFREWEWDADAGYKGLDWASS
ncbi:Cytokinin riboside 5'-monophosphate phosphoribohydrolase LOG [Phaffia rhodozyma]|uniref:Cytokinin riboside 5'-monophosphate phosphoribohydrolase LOG n=1 Tax=Phaffia rhodozyma TaxID=264483 RepID=A0A0F7SWB9_PHARH|nr:Cytokinin riboside 5'-monophosphate phosphoribohydrolase LOG [Phaffia rhodozyma]